MGRADSRCSDRGLDSPGIVHSLLMINSQVAALWHANTRGPVRVPNLAAAQTNGCLNPTHRRQGWTLMEIDIPGRQADGASNSQYQLTALTAHAEAVAR